MVQTESGDAELMTRVETGRARGVGVEGHVTETLQHITEKRLWWPTGSVLAFGTHVRNFKHGLTRRIFHRAKKSSARLPSEGK